MAREGQARTGRIVAAAAVLVMIGLAGPGLTLVAGAAPEPLAVFPYVERSMQGLETHFITPQPTTDDLYALAFAPDRHLVLAAGSHNQVLSWDPNTNASRLLNNGTLGVLYGLAWKDDSSEALAVGSDGGLFMYSDSGGAVTALAPENASVTWVGVAHFPGRGYLVAGTAGQMFFLNGSARTAVASPTGENLLHAAYSPVGDFALVVGWNGTVVRVNRTGPATLVPSPSSDLLRGVSFESDTGRALVVGGQGALMSYDGSSLSNESHVATAGEWYAVGKANSTSHAVVAIANQTAGWVLFHNSTSDQLVSLGSGLTRGRAIAVDTRDGSAVCAGIAGTLFRVWRNGTVVNISDAFQPPLFDASWSPDGGEALMVGSAGTVFHYDRTNDSVSKLVGPVPNADLTGVSWASNGSGALITGFQALWWYDRASGNLSEPSGAVTQDLTGVAWRPNTSQAVVVGTAGYVGLWDSSGLSRLSSTSLFNTFTGLAWHTDASGTGDFVTAVGSNVVARWTPGVGFSTTTRIGTFFGVGYQGDDVWAVGRNATHFYDSTNGIWETKQLDPQMQSVWVRALAVKPGSNHLLAVGDGFFLAYLNSSGVNRFFPGYNADFFAADYNPVTGEALIVGAHLLAFTLREGTFPNLAPTVTLGSPADGANYTTADTVSFDASASFDPDNDPLTISWFDSASGFLTAGASFGAQLPAGDHLITVYVDDGAGHNVSASALIHVLEAQYAPVAVIASPDPNVTWRDDQTLTFDASPSYDPNANDTLSFLWVSSVDGALGNTSTFVRALSAATHQITLTITDSTGLSVNRSFVLQVIPGNRPPILAVASPSAGVLYHANIPITFDARSTTDPDSPSFTVRWVVDGLEIGQGLVLNRTLTEGTHTLLVEASDGTKTSSQTFQVNVGAPLNLEPVFADIEPADGATLVGRVVFNGTMVDDPAGPVTMVEVQFGQGTAWIPAQGTATWSASLDTAALPNGAIVISFRARDSEYTVTVTRTYTIDNPFVNSPPTVVVLTPRPGTTVAALITLAGTVDDADGDAVTVEWRLSNGGNGSWNAAQVTGPTWSATVDISGLPNGPATFEVRASDGTNTSETAVLTVIVDNPAAPGGFLPGAGAALAAVALAVAAASLARRKRVP